MTSPKEEAEELMSEMLPIAERLLEKNGEFYPFGGALLRNGKVGMIATYDGDEHPESQRVIDDLLKSFRSSAKKGEYKATALVYEILTLPPGETEKIDAIAVRLDHESHYSVVVVFPYRISPTRKVTLLDPFAARGPGDAFA